MRDSSGKYGVSVAHDVEHASNDAVRALLQTPGLNAEERAVIRDVAMRNPHASSIAELREAILLERHPGNEDEEWHHVGLWRKLVIEALCKRIVGEQAPLGPRETDTLRLPPDDV